MGHETSERKYWSASMNAAYDFMMKVRDVEIRECMEPLESLRDAADELKIEILFSDTPIAGTISHQYYLRRGLITPFVAAAMEMNDRGWVLKVEDAYRTPSMQKELQLAPELFDSVVEIVLWETKGQIPDTKFLFRRLLALIAFCSLAGTHISGSALDVSVYDRNTGNEIDRGGPYLKFGVVTPMDSPFINEQARFNRQEITQLMNRHGFIDYPWEFWHYNQGDSYDVLLSGDATRGRYGPVIWDSGTETVSVVANARERLNSDEEIREMLEAAIERRRHVAT